MNHISRICLGLVSILGINSAIVAEPVVPGFEVEVYAEVPYAMRIAFDPSGILYVGNNETNLTPIRVRRVGIGGSPVEEIGDGLFSPDAVGFDASGAISGIAGSVLVGGFTTAEGYLAAILPDGTTTTLFSGSRLFSPSKMEFDRYGRLLIGDFEVLVTTGDLPTALIPLTASGSFAKDGAGKIYMAHARSPFEARDIRVATADGELLSEPFATIAPDPGEVDLAFAPLDSVWKGNLLWLGIDGTLKLIDDKGVATQVGHGFPGPRDMKFGPDGALYVSSDSAGLIWRINPADFLTVSVDIKPDSDKNPVNPKSKGKLKVAVITTDEFDASTVDAESVLFGPGEAKPVWYRLDDVDHDSDLDLALKFNIRETGIACGDTQATLIGETFDGVHFTGTDSIQTVGCEPNNCNKKKHHYKHRDDDCDGNEKHHGRHKDKEHHSKHHGEDRYDDKKR